MSTVLRIGTQGKGQTALSGGEELDTRIALIQALPQLRIALKTPVMQGEGGDGSVMMAGGCSWNFNENRDALIRHCDEPLIYLGQPRSQRNC